MPGQEPQGATRRVLCEHRASYPNPVTLAKGEVLRLSGRSELWDGYLWLWAVDGSGREGWVPDSLPDNEGPLARAIYDYSAMELSVAVGDLLFAMEERHGWAWCRNGSGQEGWVPVRNLATS